MTTHNIRAPLLLSLVGLISGIYFQSLVWLSSETLAVYFGVSVAFLLCPSIQFFRFHLCPSWLRWTSRSKITQDEREIGVNSNFAYPDCRTEQAVSKDHHERHSTHPVRPECFGRPSAEQNVSKDSTLVFVPLVLTLVFFFAGGLLLRLQFLERDMLLSGIGGKRLHLIGRMTDKGVWPGKGDIVRLSVSDVVNVNNYQHHPVSCEVLCYLRGDGKCLQVGDTVMVRNTRINLPPDRQSFDGQTYDDYLLKQGAVAAIFASGGKQCKVVHRPTWSLQRFFWKLRDRVYTGLQRRLSPQTFKYLSLIFLGNKQQADVNTMRATFNQWGVAHHLARSGLHIVLFIVMWTSLLRLVPVHCFLKKLMLILLCLVYACLSWSSLPFVRALYAFLLMQVGHLFCRQANYLHLLSIICLVLLLFNPLQLFFLDFQLSFALTFSLVFLSLRSTR